jgi:hypothetical protein
MQHLASLFCLSVLLVAPHLCAEVRLQYQGMSFHMDEVAGRYGFFGNGRENGLAG